MSRLWVLFALLVFPVAALNQQAAIVGDTPADVVYARPGQLIDAGGFRLNLYCMGTGSPVVVFDSGWGDWAPAWSKVQPEIAKWTRACSYDRAGTGFSEPGPMPRTSARISEELRTALHNAGLAGPYILVASAFGGDNMRAFADLHMDEVAGLVMVDADPDDLEPVSMQEETHKGHASIPPRLRDCRDAITRHKPGEAQPACAQKFFFRGLPESQWSAELNASVLEIAQTKVAMYDAYASEMEQTPADEAWLQRHQRSFGSRPIRVLTSGNHRLGHLETKPDDTPKHLEYERETTKAQARWLELSSNARQIFARNSSEYIQFDESQTVINAVREVYDQSRRVAKAASSVFRDCAECPEMAVIPAGTFRMGSTEAAKSWAVSQGASPQAIADESPDHSVALSSFALSKYDVTRGEYAAFVRETGYSAGNGCHIAGAGMDNSKWPNPTDKGWHDTGFEQTDRSPVVCVSWQDARAYLAWLNRKVSGRTDGPYRLPSESEWEYAARAGTASYFYWGDSPSQAAEHAWFRENSGARTHPVGEKPPNAFGLYDMVGNVWQWTEDCYAEDYKNAPTDGSAARGPADCLRVDRGGSWFYPAWLLRPTTRERNPGNGYRDVVMGFRVARSLP